MLDDDVVVAGLQRGRCPNLAYLRFLPAAALLRQDHQQQLMRQQ